MTKVVWICILLAVVATSFTAGAMSSSGTPETSRTASRMLKAGGSHSGFHGKGPVGMDDYSPVDPSPSSKAVRPGPIQHGTPLIPYIPRPSPPIPPTYGNYP